MSAIDPRTTFYVPVHADFSQVEQIAAIVGTWPHGRVFLYDFNPKLRVRAPRCRVRVGCECVLVASNERCCACDDCGVMLWHATCRLIL